MHIPVLETERLILRAPQVTDADMFEAFFATERSQYVGGPVTDRRHVTRSFGNIAGLWVLRGVSMFVAEEKANPGHPIGSFGPYEPLLWPEMEFGWSLWDAGAEGKGYVTEALRVIIPWTWARTGKTEAVSFIDALNERSRNVAKALGATFDAEVSEQMNAPGGLFHDAESDHNPVTVWRHRRETWDVAA